MNTESIQQRAKESLDELCQRCLTHPESVAGEAILDVLTKALTTQQAEDAQAHKAKVERLKEQVEELTKDKVMLDWLSTRSWNVFWLGTDTWGIAGVTTRGTLREAITSAMKGKTNE